MKEELIKYIQENNRVCPQPIEWNELWELLLKKSQKSYRKQPLRPLILGAWWNTSDEDKCERLITHINYASENDVLKDVDRYLRSLNKDQWIYEGEV